MKKKRVLIQDCEVKDYGDLYGDSRSDSCREGSIVPYLVESEFERWEEV